MTDGVSPAQHPPPQRSTLGVLLSQFPRYDEAFILRELTALSREPWDLAIYSLRPCHDAVIHDQAKPFQPATIYAPFLWSRAVWASHAWFLRRNPQGYWSSLGWIVSRHWRHPIAFAKALILFPKTVHFARLMQARGVRHVHAFWATYPTVSAMAIERLTGIPFSLSGHAHDIYTANPALPEKLRCARFVLTCTEANRQHLLSLANGHGADHGIARPTSHVSCPIACPILVSYHGVDLSRFAPKPKRNEGRCRLLCVGSLLPCKGLESLIDAVGLLAQRGVNVTCTIAGGGPLEGALRARIARAGLTERISITGFVSQERVARYYQEADLFVLPLLSKIHWGIPNVLIEALATKTPVICCDLPSMNELIAHGASGWIIPEGDPKAIADAVVTLTNDPALRARLAEAGHAQVLERFALEQTGERLRQIFREHSALQMTTVAV